MSSVIFVVSINFFPVILFLVIGLLIKYKNVLKNAKKLRAQTKA